MSNLEKRNIFSLWSYKPVNRKMLCLYFATICWFQNILYMYFNTDIILL